MDGATTLFSADFDTDEEGFAYRDDAFRGTSAALYADGEREGTGGFSGGALQVTLGGVDNANILGMSGGWDRSFTLTEPQQVTLTFRYNLTQASNYENDEFSEVLVALDGVLKGTDGNDFVARITGNGNGGAARSTGWQEVEIDLGLLEAGDHTVTLGGFNNKKTLADEETEILFDDVEVKAETPPEQVVLLQSDFEADTGGFTYIDDAFRGTSEPDYADGQRSATDGFGGGGALRVDLGGEDNSDVEGMSGGWQQSFTLTEQTNVTLTFRFKLTQAANYENDEFSQVLVSLDGTLVGTDGNDFIAQITGNGNGGGERTTDWQVVELDLGLLGPGEHTFVLGGFNNKKTLANESTEILFDDVLLTAEGTASPDLGPIFDLSSLDGSNGFLIAGADLIDSSGWSVSSAGDVNGDGFEDVIISAITADGGPGDPTEFAGESYVVFGRASGFSSVLELSSLDGSNGFVLAGIEESDFSGSQVSGAGDVNGDGIADVIVGAYSTDGGPGNPTPEAGEVYVVFGQATGFGSVLSFSSLDGSNGFIFAGETAPSQFGKSVSGAGDINGDGFDDLIVGALLTDGVAGRSYVVFGTDTGFSPVLNADSLDGSNGFLIPAIDGEDRLGASVSGAGDVNGDGIDDFVVGASHADVGSNGVVDDAGETYVVFGRVSGFGSSLQLSSLDGSNGFIVSGIDIDDLSGTSVSNAGDVNGDGFADLIIGAIFADGGPANATDFAGEAYVVFGQASGFGSEVDLATLDGSDGFLIAGLDESDYAGQSVSGAGDVNGDGIDDLIVGTRAGDGGPGNPLETAGESYLIFGRDTGFGSALDPAALTADQGFVIPGIEEGDAAGLSVSDAGDVNGDGFADIIIGARNADGGPDNTPGDAGESYVIFGGDFTGAVDQVGDAGANTLTGAGDADVLLGAQGNDLLIGGGGSDVLYGGEGDDEIRISDDGFLRVDGGTGFDTLVIDTPGTILDLATIADSKLTGIEQIDLNFDNNTLILNPLEVLNLSDSSNTLRVRGVPGDKVLLQGNWNFDRIEEIDGEVFRVFSSGAARVQVQDGVSATDTIAFRSDFEGLSSFGYLDDAFRGTNAPTYADGGLDATAGSDGGGAFRIDLGGVDDADIEGMSGGGRIDFVTARASQHTLTFRYKLTQAANYESDEFSQLLVSVDGTLVGLDGEDFVAQIVGNGNGGPERTTGWQQVTLDLGVLEDGIHEVTIGGFNNKKTLANESTEILIDDVLLTAEQPTSFDLRDLDGDNGFLIDGDSGTNFDSLIYASVSAAGDINGDGFEDLLLGSSFSGLYDGDAYVIFGSAGGFGSSLALTDLDGANGFALPAVNPGDGLGHSVSGGGDINGDGFADFVVGTYFAHGGPDNTPSDAGEAYVVFGRSSGFGASFAPSNLDGSNGFLIAGIDEDDRAGQDVSVIGDINGDGFDDLLLSARLGDGGPGNPRNDAGESYVIFGQSSGFGSVFELSSLDGSNGFVLISDPSSRFGLPLSGIGDIDGDGIDDIAIDGGDTYDRGFVLFGRDSGFDPLLDLTSLDGTDGFQVEGGFDAIAPAGDINGDGLGDVIVNRGGSDFVVFGTTGGFPATLDPTTLDGSNGFVFGGLRFSSVSSAGDVNGDGFDDLLLGNSAFSSAYESSDFASGESYLIFGRADGFDASLDALDLDGANGFVLSGPFFEGLSGADVSSAGDVNGDGFDDLAIVDDLGQFQLGAARIVFGKDFTGAVDQEGGDGADTLVGDGDGNVLLGGLGNDTLDGNGGADVLYGGEGDDEIRVSDSGFQRVDGGTGTDTLVIDVPGTTLDLTAIADSKLRGIEQIDLNFGSNTLILSPLEVLNLSDSSNRLVVFGEPGDTVQASDEWTFQGFDSVDGVQVAKYASGAAQLWIETAVTAELSATIELSLLDGDNGFVIAGIDNSDESGYSVSGAGDVNADGFDDLIIGASRAEGGPDNVPNSAGESYVVFGMASGFGSVLELSSLDGSNGFLMVGVDANDRAGFSVSGAGDVNGDGFADLIIGAPFADGGLDNSDDNAGDSYVVFGRSSGFGSLVELSSLDGTNGFQLFGIDVGDNGGRSVSGAGDVNGDGFADLIVGARYASESYLIYGKAAGFGSAIELSSLDGTDGFTIAGIRGFDQAGFSVSGAGDVDGDGLADFIVGAAHAAGVPIIETVEAGESYLVFGRATGFGSVLELWSIDGSNGFLIRGIDSRDLSGSSVSGAGDVNGDGLPDLIVGAPRADGGPDNLLDEAGESYVIFGPASGFGSVVELSTLDGGNGFTLAGIDEGDFSGFSVSGAGDVNADGVDDLIIGALLADGKTDNPASRSGESYLVFGQSSGFNSLLDLDALTADQGFLIAGIDVFDSSGRSVSGAGDVNGDGFADLIIGANFADGGPDNTPGISGESYVIFGGDFTGAVTQQGDQTANTLTGTAAADVVLGAQGDDELVGGGGADVLYGGEGDDRIAISDLGFQRVDGGTGTDTLVIDVPGTTIDLGTIADSKLTGIEQIDLNFDSNTLVLSPLEVLNLSDSSNRLVVFGEPGDEVQASGEWIQSLGFVEIDGLDFIRFTSGAAELLIQDGVTATLNATSPLPVIELSSLDGDNGFLLAGIDGFDYSGRSVSWAGDVNGDGFEDVIVGADEADGGPTDPNDSAGESYVVFGQASGFASVIELSSLDGSNGFILTGADPGDDAGIAVSGIGDFNGDGLADLLIGAPYANPGVPNTNQGETYVVFGRATGFGSQLQLSALDGSSGFRLDGIDPYDYAGRSVSAAGDINGDGFADLILGSPGSDYSAPGTTGESYVIFGRASGFGSVLELSSLDGSDGFVLSGIDGADRTGYAVSGAGDINGDGIDDVIVGALLADGGPDDTPENAGESYVLFGSTSGFGSVFDLSTLDGSNGFLLAGIDGFDFSGRSVSAAGDVNGDGIEDVIIGADEADGGPGNPTDSAGESYLIFGSDSGFGSLLELSSLDGVNGVIIAGADSGDDAGIAVSGAGDVNGDGLSDLLIGVPYGNPDGPNTNQGETYVVFGRATGFGSLLQLSTLDGSQGFRLDGIDPYDYAGRAVSGAGDINGDGFDDMILGAPGSFYSGASNTGESYVIFGGDFTSAVDQLGDEAANELTGSGVDDVLLGAQGNDTLVGNGGADVLYGGEGDDILAISDDTIARLKGGTGEDTLRLDGAGFTLDLTTLSDLKIESIEVVDLQEGAGAHTLTLDLLEVLNLSEASNSLTVLGDSADTVNIGAGWTSQGAAGGFETFT